MSAYWLAFYKGIRIESSSSHPFSLIIMETVFRRYWNTPTSCFVFYQFDHGCLKLDELYRFFFLGKSFTFTSRKRQQSKPFFLFFPYGDEPVSSYTVHGVDSVRSIVRLKSLNLFHSMIYTYFIKRNQMRRYNYRFSRNRCYCYELGSMLFLKVYVYQKTHENTFEISTTKSI